ncbi:MAG TPA: NAD(P)/FAD-dependent oxidoreductase [Solirubrobacterales bacterium]|jgi:cation diffusion facilitator CzcD-associated flavoprotein CzcO
MRLASTTDHVDVLIVGAGLSGIGAAHHLQRQRPRDSWAIVEAREAIGGTWDLFRYPGIRSDSDMHTLGYRFRPWVDQKAIADGDSILRYVRETAREAGIDEKIRFDRRVVAASWSSEEALWTVTLESGAGKQETLTCGYLWMCSGYYRYDQGFTPEFPGIESFAGEVIHPQHWPEDADYAGKRVVVIGSGATAVTLVPALAEKAARVTMLQRSPTYIVSVPGEDAIANRLRSAIGERRAYSVVRWKNVALQSFFFRLSRRRPKLMRSIIRRGVVRALPPGFDVDTHFNPRYNPWDQRVCLVPDSDLFDSLANGSAEVVTDQIKTFDEGGIELESGRRIDADVVVTATGLNLLFLGGARLEIDGEEADLAHRFTYKGMMLNGVPNFAFTIGYTNASWTLKADLVAEYVCRLLGHMEAGHYDHCAPEVSDPGMGEEPLLDFNSGYVLRSIAELPKQGSKEPWKLRQNYPLDLRSLRFGPVDDQMRFGRSRERAINSSESAQSGPALAGSSA